jgi:hypothetical protein
LLIVTVELLADEYGKISCYRVEFFRLRIGVEIPLTGENDRPRTRNIAGDNFGKAICVAGIVDGATARMGFIDRRAVVMRLSMRNAATFAI